MRKLMTLILMFTFAFGLIVDNAYAKRFGGGRSFGMQRSVTKGNYAGAQSSRYANRPSGLNRFIAPMIGVALGAILASLLMGKGFGMGVFAWIAIAALAYGLFALFRRSKLAAQNNQFNSYQRHDNSDQYNLSHNRQGSQHQDNSFNAGAMSFNASFDESAFLRDAKVYFLRLQTAYDQKNLQDIRDFTSPEVYAEVQMQINERGDETNFTEVVAFDAELVDVDETDPRAKVASVRFSGTLRENPKEPADAFGEIWHFQQFAQNDKWRVVGIQQV